MLSLEFLPTAILAILTAILGVGRLTRVIVYDDFPPAMWWRKTWTVWTNSGPWSKLFLCWWCLSFWVAVVCIAWYAIGFYWVAWLYWAWWFFWGALAVGYLATMVIVRDEPRDE